MTTTAESVQTRSVQGRIATSRGLWTMVVALVLLAVAGLLFASTSMSKGALQGMLPFAAVLAIVALGQTLVIQQGRLRPVGAGLGLDRRRHLHAPARGRQRQAPAGGADGARRRGRGRPGQRHA